MSELEHYHTLITLSQKENTAGGNNMLQKCVILNKKVNTYDNFACSTK